MKKITLIIFILVSLGCSAYGPLVKPSQDSIKEYINNNPQLSDAVNEALIKRKIIIGMTKDDVKILWGEPDVINFPEGQYGKLSEYWRWKGALFNSVVRNCTVEFFKDKVVDVGCSSFWGK